MIKFPHSDDPIEMIAKARALADDVERILANRGPYQADLGGAPVLDLYRFALCPSPRLVGIVGRHPHLRDQRTIMTSPLCLIDQNAGWARTWSRFYALGRPVDLNNGRPT
jgi:hypothetical protein